MKTMNFLMLVLCVLLTSVSCSDNDADKYWLETTNEASVSVQSCQAKAVYSDVLNRYVLSPVEQSICGTYYVVNNKEDNFLESYKDKEITFSGTARKAKLCHNGDGGLDSTEYYLLELEEINGANK